MKLVTTTGQILFELDDDTLAGKDLRGVDLRNAELKGEDLACAKLQGANLQSADLRYADLREADFSGANLQRAGLQVANARHAIFRNTTLRWANLRDMNLRDADMSQADLRSANMQSADIRGTCLRDTVGLTDPSEWLSSFKYDGRGVLVYTRASHQNPTTLTSICNPSRTDIFGSGIEFSTKEWAYKQFEDLPLWLARIDYRDLAGVIVPYNSNGHARCSRITLLDKV